VGGESGREIHRRCAGAHPDRCTIVAVSRKAKHRLPGPGLHFGGDIAVVIGETEQLQEFDGRSWNHKWKRSPSPWPACCLAFVSKRVPLLHPLLYLAGVILGERPWAGPCGRVYRVPSYLGLIFSSSTWAWKSGPEALLRQGKPLLISGFIDAERELPLAFLGARRSGFPPGLLVSGPPSSLLVGHRRRIAVENRKLLLPESETSSG